jgi:hypothetical protein
MRNTVLARLQGVIRRAERWYLETPDRALDLAYDAALKIRAIENEHFNGKKISPNSASFSPSAYAYFDAELKKHLRTMRMRMTEFRRSRAALGFTNPNKEAEPLRTIETTAYGSDRFVPNVRDKPAITLEKLKFIDEIFYRYALENLTLEGVSSAMLPSQPQAIGLVARSEDETKKMSANVAESSDDFESISDKTGLLPRSILTTLNRLKRDLDPESEQEVVQNYRQAKARTLLAVRFVLMLALIPLLVQQVTHTVLLSNSLPTGAWIMQHFEIKSPDKIFLNSEMTEEALKELQHFEERIKFENFIRETLERKTLPEEEVEALAKTRAAAVATKVREKATKIAELASHESANAIKNWISDILGAIAFAIVLLGSRQEVEILKSFIDEVAYGLSDSAKAFIIILFTDIFVGFHSPHGWEVILEGISRHFGLPANRDFIFLFIATFPVILDTIFKYWIFRYLNRVSPSAVATYREMNE